MVLSKDPGISKGTICSAFGIKVSANLGRYLGAPLIHGRIVNITYQYVIAKIRSKLLTWKMRVLSKVARALLIRTTLIAIPSYIMQTTLLPKGIMKEVNKLCRSFLWGDSLGTRKLHSVNWRTVCKTRAVGGLGIPDLEGLNLCMLAKLGWKVISGGNSLTTSILKEKSGGWSAL